MRPSVDAIVRDLAALAAGALLPLSLSPFDWWPLALISPLALFFAVSRATVSRSVIRFYLYNLGMFGVGVSWIFVSVHQYGGASVWLAACLVGLFVAAYSLVSVPLAHVYARWFRRTEIATVFGFAALWVLQEWFRSWFLTGFPWLFLGYGVMATPIANLAPYIGVFGLSFVVVLMMVSLVAAFRQHSAAWLLPLMFFMTAGLLTARFDQTSPAGSMSVSLVQGNIDQHIKWNPVNRLPILQLYEQASQDEWGRDLILWPEAALTMFRETAAPFLTGLDETAAKTGTALVLGIPDRDIDGGFQNTLLAAGLGQGHYIKRRLVPFGEYVPLESYLRGLITFFDLPMSRNQPGPPAQPPLTVKDWVVSPSICYEVVYPELVRTAARSPDLLLTVSNDTWFGTSIGPWQHLQMARMRALENGRSMVRATNNGITAVIDHRGRVLASLPQFERGVLRYDVEIRRGDTLFHQFGSLPVLMLALLLLATAFLRNSTPAE